MAGSGAFASTTILDTCDHFNLLWYSRGWLYNSYYSVILWRYDIMVMLNQVMVRSCEIVLVLGVLCLLCVHCWSWGYMWLPGIYCVIFIGEYIYYDISSNIIIARFSCYYNKVLMY